MTLLEHVKRHLKLAVPVVIGQLGHIMVSVADTVMVGRVGVVPLAAATFAGTFYHVLMLFGIGLSYAITPMLASLNESNQEVKTTFLKNALFINTLAGILMVALLFGISPFLGSFGQEVEVARQAGPFLLILGSSLLPLMLFQTFRQYAEGLSDTFSPMLVSIAANIINVILNYVLIFGKFGFPEWGLNGAAWATLIARLLMVIFMIGLIRKKFSLLSHTRLDKNILRKMFRMGTGSGLQYVFEVGAFATAAIMVGWFGAVALAAHQVALNIAAVSYMAATGIAAAATIRVGNQITLPNNTSNIRLAGLSAVGIVVGFMSLTGILFIFFRQTMSSWYVEDVEVIALASSLLIIAAAFQISDGLQTVGLGILRGMHDVKVPTLVTFLSFWALAIPLAYLLGISLGYGVYGIWTALLIGLSVAASLHILRFFKLIKRY